ICDSVQSGDSCKAGRHYQPGSGERPQSPLPERSRHANGIATVETRHGDRACASGEFGNSRRRTRKRTPSYGSSTNSSTSSRQFESTCTFIVGRGEDGSDSSRPEEKPVEGRSSCCLGFRIHCGRTLLPLASSKT